MSSSNFTCVGPGEVLAYLRGDLRRASKSLLIIGPWLDDYFAEKVVEATAGNLFVRTLVRPESEVDSVAEERTRAALSIFAKRFTRFEVRELSRLHAKCICIDDQVLYIGSANWYRYSLENGIELVLRGQLDVVENAQSELERLWERGTSTAVVSYAGFDAETKKERTGIGYEVLDPLAAQALKENPKAFVLGKKTRRR